MVISLLGPCSRGRGWHGRPWARRFGAWGGGGVDLGHGLVHLASQQQGPRLEAVGNAVFYGALLIGGGFFQHPAGNFTFMPRMANANAQPPIIAAAQLGVDIAQAIVATVAATFFEFDLAGCKVQLIVHDQNFIGLDFEKPGQRRHRFARQIHKGLWLQQPQRVPLHIGTCRQPPVTALGLQVHLEFARQGIHPPKTGVVAGVEVFGAGIAQANNQLDHGVTLFSYGAAGPHRPKQKAHARWAMVQRGKTMAPEPSAQAPWPDNYFLPFLAGAAGAAALVSTATSGNLMLTRAGFLLEPRTTIFTPAGTLTRWFRLRLLLAVRPDRSTLMDSGRLAGVLSTASSCSNGVMVQPSLTAGDWSAPS